MTAKHRRPSRLLLAVVWFVLAGWLGAALGPVTYLIVTGDFPGSHAFYGLQEDDPLVTWLLSLHR